MEPFERDFLRTNRLGARTAEYAQWHLSAKSRLMLVRRSKDTIRLTLPVSDAADRSYRGPNQPVVRA
jgi:hypothetical protein